jgi:integrase
MQKLTFVKVQKAKGPAVLHDGEGLYLKVSRTGAKSWIFRFQINGRRRDMGLGRYPDVSLADARRLVAEHRARRQSGVDPLVAREADRQARRLAEARGKTFRETAEEFVARKEAEWVNAAHRQQWRQTLADYVYPVIGHFSVAAIDVSLVLKVLEPLWAERTHLASRIRGRIEMILDAATVRGYRTGPNPAMWKGNLAHILPNWGKVHRAEHHPALPFNEMPEMFAELDQQGGIAARALQFLILTAARLGEVVGATWGEIDLPNKVWVVPAARMKMNREHRVPLSDAAMHVLQRVQPWSLMAGETLNPAAPLFPGIRPAIPLSDSALRAVLIRMGRKKGLTLHGFRSTFATWAAEATMYQYEIREMALAHNVGSAVERAYQRSDLFDRRRRLMSDWGRFCTLPPATGEVVPLHAGR